MQATVGDKELTKAIKEFLASKTDEEWTKIIKEELKEWNNRKRGK